MKNYTIIWDFDGTLLPSDPYDSEQTLLLHRLHTSGEPISASRRIIAKAAIYADRKEWLGASFKKFYLWVLRGSRIEILDRVSEILAKKITPLDRRALKRLSQKGHHMMVISCGTMDLIEATLQRAGLDRHFEIVPTNRFKKINGRISAMAYRILRPEDKLVIIHFLKLSPDNTIAIGDGYTDLPLLDWASVAVMMDRNGKKKQKYSGKDYIFISSIAELEEIIVKQATCRSSDIY
ncbi:MAG: HAD-IB family phosphatase [Desulfobacterales bacterium]|jgi:HAD superfamily phosphoserine phosphatase-like hydrolase